MAARSEWEAEFDDALDVVIGATEGDPDPVSMITQFKVRPEEPTATVVVLRDPAVIEMLRQWAERQGIYRRDRDIDGTPREEAP